MGERCDPYIYNERVRVFMSGWTADAMPPEGLTYEGVPADAAKADAAWLHEPYADADCTTGNRYLDTEAITAHLAACTEAGVTAGFHVIGDAAVTAAVDAFDAVVAKYGAVAVARCGHRLEHVEMITGEQAAKLGSWGVIASMQPGFDALWGGESGMYAQRLGIDSTDLRHLLRRVIL